MVVQVLWDNSGSSILNFLNPVWLKYVVYVSLWLHGVKNSVEWDGVVFKKKKRYPDWSLSNNGPGTDSDLITVSVISF